MISWIYLGVAVLFEAAWVIGLRFVEGWTRLWPSVFVVACYGLGLVLLVFAGRGLAPSILYPVWVGGGIVLVTCADWMWFGEAFSLAKLAFVGMILVGVVGLKLNA